MTKIFLLCITLLVVVLFFISFTHIEELGKDYVGIIIISVLPLLGLACVITFCFGRLRLKYYHVFVIVAIK